MEYNLIRNYNELTDNGVKKSEKYLLKKLPLNNDEDRESCLRFLTQTNQHLLLCHNHYNTDYINTVIEESKYLLYFHKESAVDDIVSFALLKTIRRNKNKNILNILLLCALPNNKKFGQMMANSVYTFAKERDFGFIYTMPRTKELRDTFVKYGFETIYGIEGIDEVLEKDISQNETIILNCSKTRKLSAK